MNILFCNISWMKYYEGVTDQDKPKNGGAYVKENNYGNECCNFLGYNGKCYGFVMLNGNINLDKHFEGVTKQQAFVKDVLVVWVATNTFKETRVVGWYKQATVYRQEQNHPTFTNRSYDLCYRVEASTKDCYLLPEKERTFVIPRASRAGTGHGMGRSNIWYGESETAKKIIIPNLLEYIQNYQGVYENWVVDEEELNQRIEGDEFVGNYEKSYAQGVSYLETDILKALAYLNTARDVKETLEVLNQIADVLYMSGAFNEAIQMLSHAVDLYGEEKELLSKLLNLYDLTWNREKVIVYGKKVLELEKDEEERLAIMSVLFETYLVLDKPEQAKQVMEELKQYTHPTAREYVEEMKEMMSRK